MSLVSQGHGSQRAVSSLIPTGAWDSHMHLFDPASLPEKAGRSYVPPEATAQQAETVLGKVTPNMCIVQPSIYGTDNRVTLQGVKDLGIHRACAVIELDPDHTTKQMMQDWHAAGARGVRVNCVSRGLDPDAKALESDLIKYADMIRPFGWVLQLYVPLSLMDEMSAFINDLGVAVCLDHFGHPAFLQDSAPSELAGLESTLSALCADGSNLWIKLSGQYRLLPPTPDQTYRPLKKLFLAYLDAAPDRLVYASDWPHTRFEEIDTLKWADTLVDWCSQAAQGDEAATKVLVENIFKHNAQRLWFGRDEKVTNLDH